jgi:hypothetical protein
VSSVWVWEELVNGKWVPWQDRENCNLMTVHPTDRYMKQPEPHTPQYGRFRFTEYRADTGAYTRCKCLQAHHCHVCEVATLWACSDCRINFGVSVYVCENSECCDKHEKFYCAGPNPLERAREGARA